MLSWCDISINRMSGRILFLSVGSMFDVAKVESGSNQFGILLLLTPMFIDELSPSNIRNCIEASVCPFHDCFQNEPQSCIMSADIHCLEDGKLTSSKNVAARVWLSTVWTAIRAWNSKSW